ncbi:FHA domain-containing protein [Cellulomonas triticagri]|uniref:FHA domain-containing protein n=1 Tax=Cellulomonas triticagri TaxID=2483352 RepID=A0A3M2JED5_9CELL|nr:FHA domain-containing protein [Cellulomonas triticagri]RMI09315.1 FHA domain-containing protein [Cellulomonas triticagri]
MIVPEYTPGDWYAVVANGVVLLLAPSTPPEVVRDVWAAAPERGGGLGAQLDALVRHGIGGLHPFAAVDLSTGQVHTALRGDVEVEVVRGTRAEVLAAPDVVSWSERSVGSADEVRVRATGSARGSALPIVSGVVRASRVRVRVAGAQPAAAEPTPSAGPVVLPASPTPVATVPAAVVPVPEAVAAEDAEPVAVPTPVAGVDVDAEGAVAETAGTPEPVEVVGADEPAQPDRAAQPGQADEALADVAPEPEAGTGTEDDGADAASHVTAQPDHEPEPAADVPTPDVSDLDADTGPVPVVPTPSLPAPAPAPATGPFVPPPAPALPGPASADDHDGLTILSGELASIRQHLPSWAVSQTGDWPSLPTPATGQTPPPVTGAVPVTAAGSAPTTHAPAPLLALSTGARVPVDGVVLIGRAPQAGRAPDGAEPRLVTVPSPEQDISRTHAEVRLELGRVLVTDLYSTNGITVASGGLPPRRISAGEPVAVGEGDLVDLGDGVTFTVEPGA